MYLMKRVIPLLAFFLILTACTTNLQRKEQYLKEAGFRAVTPATTAQIAKVKAFPQGHIHQVSKKGKTLFLLADAKQNLLLVGGNTQFEKYQQLLYSKKINPEIANEKAIRMEQAEWDEWGGYYAQWAAPSAGRCFIDPSLLTEVG